MRFNTAESERMVGTLEGFEVTHGSFGQQYTRIGGQVYVTWFDLCNANLRGLGAGVKVEFDTWPAPTVLCHSPCVQDNLPSARLFRVVRETTEAR